MFFRSHSFFNEKFSIIYISNETLALFTLMSFYCIRYENILSGMMMNHCVDQLHFDNIIQLPKKHNFYEYQNLFTDVGITIYFSVFGVTTVGKHVTHSMVQ